MDSGQPLRGFRNDFGGFRQLPKSTAGLGNFQAAFTFLGIGTRTAMSDSVRILMFVAVALCGGLVIYSVTRLNDRPSGEAELTTPQVFEWLDQACQRRFGANYTFRTNRCCEANGDICAAM